MDNQSDLNGQVALVTGGGRGLGRAFAQALAAVGAAVSVTARSRNQLEETVKSIEAQGGRAISVVGDISNIDDAERIASFTEEQLGPVDLLVNNAAVGGEVKPDWETDPQDWWRTLEINLRGPYLCIRRILPGMVARKKGRVINLSSGAVQGGLPYLGAYTVSKTALTQYSNLLAGQLRDTGVSVFAYEPGFVRTYMTEVHGLSPEIHSSVRDLFKTSLEQGTDTPIENSVRTFMFLVSGQADALSGRIISVGDDSMELLSRTEEILDKDLYTLRKMRN
jgi:NAD(P)-dependent dehydrogenase (short-subunit alcohol dehydrogenase family)